MEGRQVTED